ncbi:MAG: right-handed parallel beta-helix repeat-containing protein, partial [Planctomycetia bacterium]
MFAGDDLRDDWANLADVEVVAVHKWTMSRLPIGSIATLENDPARQTVTFAGHTRGVHEWCSFPKGNRFLAENVREALGTPGSWYLDRPTGVLTYCPLPGETPETAVVIAPVAPRLLEIRGDAAAGRFVEHVRFEGLSFAHDNWAMPRGGQSYPQAEANVGGSIVATGASRLAFDRCVVRHVGRYAVEFRAGCHDCTIDRCEFVDLGGGGVLASS